MPYNSSLPPPRASSFEDELNEEEDAELLLPSQDGTRYKKRIQKVKYSVSYLLVASAAAFILAVMIWLGPGLPNRDPAGLAAQSHATVSTMASTANSSVDHLSSVVVIPTSGSKDAHRPTLSVSAPSPEQLPLPPHRWNPLLYDPSPITHISIKPCMFPPWAFPSFCEPAQTARDQALYGKWVRVPRDLSKGVGHYYTEIYYRRMQTSYVAGAVQGVQPITGLRILEDSEAQKAEVKVELERDGWEEAGDDIRSGIWPAKISPAKLWFTRSTNYNNTVQPRPIIEVDVMWGSVNEVSPWWGFERIGNPAFGSDNPMDHIRCDIIVRRENIKAPPKPNLVFNPDGKFKILQVSLLRCDRCLLMPSISDQTTDFSIVTRLYLDR